VVNLSSNLAANLVAHFVFPVWFWLPFVALAFDHLDRRVATWTLVGFCVIQDASALLMGVAWIYPLCFTALALFCSEVSRLRHAIVRDMLEQSDRQRSEIEASHALLRHAHEGLTRETVARREAERELQQAQKLEAVGRLASGVAHEINTPIQFVGDSVQFLRASAADLVQLVEALQALHRSALEGPPDPAAVRQASEAIEAADLPFLLENVPKAFDRVVDGLGRVGVIVRSMKEFAHPDSREMATADLNRAIESTLTIARSEYKDVADVVTEFGALPPVCCYLGDFNQMILNIVVNAAHAIADVVRGTDRRGRIVVRTHRDGDEVVVAISDTGGGIPEAIRERIFDPFFTTKELGRGTGQGLSIARSVAEKHHGRMHFETVVGAGTTFFVRLPIRGGAVSADKRAAA
jgi:signal transduction histidine kinase